MPREEIFEKRIREENKIKIMRSDPILSYRYIEDIY